METQWVPHHPLPTGHIGDDGGGTGTRSRKIHITALDKPRRLCHIPLALNFTPSPTFLVSILAATCFTSAFAESRPWKSADGLLIVQAEFVQRDANSVTVRDTSGKEVTLELSKLGQAETKWLNLHHPFSASQPDPTAFFDTLTFKDNRESTLAKLRASKIVVMTTDETFLGRSGLNGVFRTSKKIGKLDGFLYFDWTDKGKLKELTLQTATIPATAYKSDLEPSWQKFVELLSILYGNPVQKGVLPQSQSIADGSFVPTHLWNLDGGGSALLGTAREGKQYQLVVRFTEKKVELKEIP